MAGLSGSLARLAGLVYVLAAIIAMVMAAPQAQAADGGTVSVETSNPSACAQIAPATSALLSRSPNATPTIPAQLAYACLASVPNKAGPAKDMIDSLKAFVQWQSTLAWLKNPPSSYMLPPADIEGGLDDIAAKATSGGFSSEYEFQLAIIKLIASAHDGHFAYRGDVFKAFVFRNDLVADIVSVSSDGKQVPKLYHMADLMGATNGTINGSAPVIVKINGQDAATLIENMGLTFVNYQDPDSQWNSQFTSYANVGASIVLAASLAYMGDNVTVTYDNGQEKKADSYATFRLTAGDFSAIKSGDDYYNHFCNPDLAAASATATSATATATATSVSTLAIPAPTIQGYPPPIVRDIGGNTTSGYFLNGTGYDDVAVLAISSFEPNDDEDFATYMNNYQGVIASFLQQCKQAGKKRLVIDLLANGGGYVIAGYELFAQLFPNVTRFQADNMRLADSLVNMARISTSILTQNITASSAAESAALSVIQQSSVLSNLVPGGVFTPEGQELKTVDQILSPVSLQNDLFTSYLQTPLDSPGSDFNVTGTGNRAAPPAVFDPQNIVLLTDGTCGSTCTIFSYLMILLQDVKTISVGGRPQTGAMQSIAGVEGAQVFPLNEISEAAAAVLALAPKDKQDALKKSEMGVIAEGLALRRAANPANAGAVNGKNAFMSNDAQVPLQFLYQGANCRFFFTADMLTSPVGAWKRAVDGTWNDPASTCVEGSRLPDTKNNVLDPLFHQAAMQAMKATAEGAAAPVGGRTSGWLAGLAALLVAVVMMV